MCESPFSQDKERTNCEKKQKKVQRNLLNTNFGIGKNISIHKYSKKIETISLKDLQ